MHVRCPSLSDSIMFCHMCVVCVCVSMCVYVCVCVWVGGCVCVWVGVYASVVFKNGKGSFTQCVQVQMHKGV